MRKGQARGGEGKDLDETKEVVGMFNFNIKTKNLENDGFLNAQRPSKGFFNVSLMRRALIGSRNSVQIASMPNDSANSMQNR